MSYLKKTIKYKNKYINLKSDLRINQRGGTITKLDETDPLFNFPIPDKKITFNTFKVGGELYGKDYSCNINLVKIKLDDKTDKPILFVVAGFSSESFMSACYVILTKLKSLQTKFSSVYIIDYSGMKDFQNFVCDQRENKLDAIPEKKLNKEIARFIHEILLISDLSEFQKENIHLLGKSNGGWIVTLLFKMYSGLYKGLYLAVPGIPNAVESLTIESLSKSSIDPSFLSNTNFVFGFCHQDAYPFGFGSISNQEKLRYDEIMQRINQTIPLKFISYSEDTRVGDKSLLPDPKMYHELYQSMIDHIILSLQ